MTGQADERSNPSVALVYDSARGRLVLAATVLGSGLAMLDGTVVNVALPRIAEDLGGGLTALQWTLNAYTLTLSGLLLLGGSLGDRMGRRRIYVIGVLWFTLASVGCAFAPRCAYATQRCRVEYPPLEEKAPRHWAACWESSRLVVDETKAAA